MNFAIVGDDPAALELVRAICESVDDRIVGAALTAKIQPEIARLAPGARITSRWDEFLTDASIDAVLVSGNNPEALNAGRQFAATGKPLLLVPRAAHGSAFLYELSLVRDDTGVLLFPALSARSDGAVDALADAIGSGRLGKLLYLEFTRTRPVDAPSGTVWLLSQSEIDEALLQDVDLLRRLGGDYNQVTALHTEAGSGGIATATVTLAGTEIPQATWTMKGSSSPSQWQLKVTGDKGSATLAAHENAACELRLVLSPETQAEQKVHAHSPNPTARGAAILARFRAARDGNAPSHDWKDLIRAMEVVEATHRSVRRRRTIDLHFESTSERSLFKTQMTAIGCGVMSFTFFAVVVLLLATAVFDVRDRQQIESERAGAVITLDEFAQGEAKLSQKGINHLDELVPRIPAGRFSVLVEQSGSDSNLDERRRAVVVTVLRDKGVHDAELRTATAELKGRWFAGLLQIARIAVFAPLFLYLLLQLLLVLTRPSVK